MSIFGIFKRKKPPVNENNVTEWFGWNESDVEFPTRIVTNRVNGAQRKEIGFYGQKIYSNPAYFCAVFCRTCEDEFNLALVDVTNRKINFRVKANNPEYAVCTKDGFLICRERGEHNKLNNCIVVYDKDGKEVLRKRHKYNFSSIFELNDLQDTIKYGLNYDHSIHELKFK